MSTLTEKTLASIVTDNFKAASVFEKYNLDFCCKGKRSLQEACSEFSLSAENIANEIDALYKESAHLPFDEMNEEELISYILIHHHFYVKQNTPLILSHLEKVANKHGDRFPYMKKVYELFIELGEELLSHLQKEEVILFPRIKELVAARRAGDALANNSFIGHPILVMEAEHEHAGELMYEIRNLTSNYAEPENACTTFRLVLSELKNFEEDLHQHVHLENNILFPKAMIA
jgi:regulator of cell morphogenesis and NO signaling